MNHSTHLKNSSANSQNLENGILRTKRNGLPQQYSSKNLWPCDLSTPGKWPANSEQHSQRTSHCDQPEQGIVCTWSLSTEQHDLQCQWDSSCFLL